MVLERILRLQTGRSVKVIAQNLSEPEMDVLIKEPKEQYYHPPIGLAHPKYWKLKQMDEQKAKLMQIRYSGLTSKQLRQIIQEFALFGITIDFSAQ